MAKKYGIVRHVQENTIGSRDSYDELPEWFDTKEERDNKYVEYTKPRSMSMDPSEVMIEMDIANSPYIEGDELETYSYRKVEE